VMGAAAPTALCQNATVTLDANGTAAVSSSLINNGSFNVCGGSVLLSVNPASFNCNQLGVNNVVLTATTAGGGASTCTSTVTVQDLQAPAPICNPATVNLGPQGTATLSPLLMLTGSIENCGVVSQVASQTLFTCADTAGTPVTITVADAAGNLGTCTSVVTAVPMPMSLQVQAPVQACGHHISCSGASDGTATAVAQGACGHYTYQWSNGATTAQVTGLAAGTYTVTVSDGVGQPLIQSITLTAPAPLQV
jgi:SprB repeat